MRKKILFLAICLVTILSFGSTNINAAQVTNSVAVPDIMPSTDGIIFGQNQYYSVVFDGEGEATVAAKLLLQNSGQDPITSTVIEIPGVDIRLIKVVEEFYQKEQYCYQYEPNFCTEMSSGGCLKYEQKCSDWRWQVKTWDPLYYTLEPQAEELSNSVKYTIELKKSIDEQGQAGILFYYKVPNYAKKSAGVFNFKFETIKASYDIDQVRVAVDVQEGLYLDGGQAQTQYRSTYDTAFKSMAPEAAGVANQALSTFSNQITYASGYVKTTSGLDPWESFTVEGKYAESRFALHKWAIIGWILGILIFLVGISFLVWFLIKRAKKRAEKISKTDKNHLLPLKIVISGIGAAFGTIVVGILGSLLIQVIQSNISYQYNTLVVLLFVLLEGIIILALVFGPSIYFGIKHGASRGVWVFVVTIVSLLILGIIMVVVLATLFGTGISSMGIR
jgi:F0F1-type ATP synthase membrane subunit c/vacuolar-type H+-ATPase subunit K